MLLFTNLVNKLMLCNLSFFPLSLLLHIHFNSGPWLRILAEGASIELEETRWDEEKGKGRFGRW
jgi:hypothetical protein